MELYEFYILLDSLSSLFIVRLVTCLLYTSDAADE